MFQLKKDNKMLCFEDNTYGQCDFNKDTDNYTNIKSMDA
jgi:hypothetical protein